MYIVAIYSTSKSPRTKYSAYNVDIIYSGTSIKDMLGPCNCPLYRGFLYSEAKLSMKILASDRNKRPF